MRNANVAFPWSGERAAVVSGNSGGWMLLGAVAIFDVDEVFRP